MEEKNKTNVEYWVSIIHNAPPAYRELYAEEEKFLRKNIPKGAKVLDIGCGDGRSLRSIEHIAKEITGIDHDDKAIELAKENFRNNPIAKFLKAEANKLPFQKNSFDSVICIGTFTNFGPIKDEALKEMKRVVKEKGDIILLAYSEKALKERLQLYKNHNVPIKKLEGSTVYFEDSVGDNISEQFSKEELKKIFDKHSLKITDLKETKIAYLCKLTK